MRIRTLAILATIGLFLAAAGFLVPIAAGESDAVLTIPGIDPHQIPGIDPHQIPGIDPHQIPGIDPH